MAKAPCRQNCTAGRYMDHGQGDAIHQAQRGRQMKGGKWTMDKVTVNIRCCVRKDFVSNIGNLHKSYRNFIRIMQPFYRNQFNFIKNIGTDKFSGVLNRS